jgi:hypothetical protein
MAPSSNHSGPSVGKPKNIGKGKSKKASTQKSPAAARTKGVTVERKRPKANNVDTSYPLKITQLTHVQTAAGHKDTTTRFVAAPQVGNITLVSEETLPHSCLAEEQKRACAHMSRMSRSGITSSGSSASGVKISATQAHLHTSATTTMTRRTRNKKSR